MASSATTMDDLVWLTKHMFTALIWASLRLIMLLKCAFMGLIRMLHYLVAYTVKQCVIHKALLYTMIDGLIWLSERALTGLIGASIGVTILLRCIVMRFSKMPMMIATYMVKEHATGAEDVSGANRHVAAATVADTPQKTRVFIAWDVENCRVPPGTSLEMVINAIEQALLKQPGLHRRLSRWYVSLSPASERAMGGPSVESQFNQRGITVLHNSGIGKTGSTDIPMIREMDSFITDWIMSNGVGPAPVLVVITGDSDFVPIMEKARQNGISVEHVHPRRPVVAAALLDLPNPRVLFDDLIANYVQGRSTMLSPVLSTPAPSLLSDPSAVYVPPHARMPTATARAASLAARVPAASVNGQIPAPDVRATAVSAAPSSTCKTVWLLQGGRAMAQGVLHNTNPAPEGPLAAASEAEVQQLLTSVFVAEPGYISLAAKADRITSIISYAWVNFSCHEEAVAAARLINGRQVQYTDRTGQTATYVLRVQVKEHALNRAPSPAPMPIAPAPPPAAPPARKVYEDIHIKVARDMPVNGKLPQALLQSSLKAYVSTRLSNRLIKAAQACKVVITQIDSPKGRGRNVRTIDFRNEAIEVHGYPDDVAEFKAVLDTGLGTVHQTVVLYDLNDFIKGPMDETSAIEVKQFAVSKLKILKQKIENTVLSGSGLVRSPYRQTRGVKNQDEFPSDGRTYFVVATYSNSEQSIPGAGVSCSPTTLTSRSGKVKDMLNNAVTNWSAGLQECPPIPISKLGELKTNVAAANKAPGEPYLIFFTCKPCKSYVVYAATPEARDQGLVHLKGTLSSYVKGAQSGELTIRVDSAATFYIAKAQTSFSSIKAQAQARDGVTIIATHQDTDAGPGRFARSFVLSGPSDELPHWKKELEDLVRGVADRIISKIVEVPTEARCLFLPHNILQVNDKLRELVHNKDNSVWVTRPAGSIRIQNFLGEHKDQVADESGADTDADDASSAVMSEADDDEYGTNGEVLASMLVPSAANPDIQHRISLVLGNIVKETTDLLVNAANGRMEHMGGVARAIATACGDDMITASAAKRDQEFAGEVPAGNGVVTGAGDLDGVQKVLHVVTKTYTGAIDDPVITDCTQKIMETAQRLKFETISTPVLGTGVFGWPMDVSMGAMLKTFAKELACVSETTMHVRIVECDVAKAIEAAGHLPALNGEPNPTVLKPQEDRVEWGFWVGKLEVDFDDSKHPGITRMPLETVNGQQGVFHSMTAAVSKAVDLAYEEWLNDKTKPCKFNMRTDNWKYAINGASYEVDYSSMTQINLNTSYKRAVRRSVLPPLPPAAPTPAHVATGPALDQKAAGKAMASAALEKSILAGPIKIQFEGFRTDVDHAEVVLMQFFDSRCLREELTYDGRLDSASLSQLHNEAHELNLIVDHKHLPKATHLVCCGTATNVRSYVKRVWTPVCIKMAQRQALRVAFPETWRRSRGPSGGGMSSGSGDGAVDNADITKFDIAPLLKDGAGGTDPVGHAVNSFAEREVRFVADIFGKTMDKNRIVQIERVQNPKTYEQFVQARAPLLPDSLVAKLPYKAGLVYDEGVNTSQNKWLWHGTRATDPIIVCKATHFVEANWSSLSCLWGPANYFAQNASYSCNGYEHTKADGTKQVLLCEVLTGYTRDFGATIQPQLRMPPPISKDDPWFPNDSDDKDPRYSSVSGVTAGSRVYMTYTAGAVRQYPHYMVTFK